MTKSSRAPRNGGHRILRILGLIALVPVMILSLLFAATPFSQIARGVLFGVVFWDGSDIEHIKVFPANDVHAAESASELPLNEDGTALEAFRDLELGQYIMNQPLQQTLMVSSEDDLNHFLADSESTSFLIVRDGVLVHEWYAKGIDPEALHNTFSVSKSILSTTIGMAIDDGHISSIEDPITDYLPELLDKDPRFGDITLRHLITMTSGIAYDGDDLSPYSDEVNTYFGTDLRQSAITNSIIVEEPGQTWLYNNYNPQLLGMALERATGMTISEYTSESWWGPMGAEADASWSVDSFYNRFEQSAHGFNARPRDLARFGLMFANDGMVDGERVIPREWVNEATASTNVSIGRNDFLEQNYNFFWWVLPDGRYSAQGHHGQYVFISPDDDTVIVRTGRGESTDWPRLLSEISMQISASADSGE